MLTPVDVPHPNPSFRGVNPSISVAVPARGHVDQFGGHDDIFDSGFPCVLPMAAMRLPERGRKFARVHSRVSGSHVVKRTYTRVLGLPEWMWKVVNMRDREIRLQK